MSKYLLSPSCSICSEVKLFGLILSNRRQFPTFLSTAVEFQHSFTFSTHLLSRSVTVLDLCTKFWTSQFSCLHGDYVLNVFKPHFICISSLLRVLHLSLKSHEKLHSWCFRRFASWFTTKMKDLCFVCLFITWGQDGEERERERELWINWPTWFWGLARLKSVDLWSRLVGWKLGQDF